MNPGTAAAGRDIEVSASRPVSRHRLAAPTAVAVLAGLLAFLTQWRALWRIWTSDPLRSIGLLIPFVCIVLAIRAWRACDRSEWRGNIWGLLLAVVAMAVALGAGISTLSIYVVDGARVAHVNLLSACVPICAYVSGCVLMFGGTRAWRAAAFPILLLLLLNPVPSAFNSLLDVPLQHLGAATARHFAALIGVPVSAGTLKMMFSPDLGIFIAPGCDGLRGATTLGLLALVLGRLHRLRPLRWLAYVIGAVLLAYVFNLIRLCAVVGYYWFALRLPSLGAYGTQIDYVIGGVLFCCAVAFLIGIPRLVRAR